MRRAAGLALVLPVVLAVVVLAEEPKPAYDFSLPRAEKISLAESAAPPEISGKATVYVLEKTGYVKVRDGVNGFSCFVDRQTPFNMEPTCFDAEGAATTLPTRLFVEEQRANGVPEEKINADLEAGYRSERFLAPRKPGIVYMLSPHIYLWIAEAKRMVHGPAHLMFYAPYATEKDLGSPPRATGMPHVIREGKPDAYIVVVPATAPSH